MNLWWLLLAAEECVGISNQYCLQFHQYYVTDNSNAPNEISTNLHWFLMRKNYFKKKWSELRNFFKRSRRKAIIKVDFYHTSRIASSSDHVEYFACLSALSSVGSFVLLLFLHLFIHMSACLSFRWLNKYD